VIAAIGVLLLMLAFAEWVILRGHGDLGLASLGLALALVAIMLVRSQRNSPPNREPRRPGHSAEFFLLSSRQRSHKERRMSTAALDTSPAERTAPPPEVGHGSRARLSQNLAPRFSEPLRSRVSKPLSEPISPELVLVDPELARIAREAL
jgi:hypothetical protein